MSLDLSRSEIDLPDPLERVEEQAPGLHHDEDQRYHY